MQLLAAAGVASRRACEQLMAEGRVAVNGQVITEQGYKIDLASLRGSKAYSSNNSSSSTNGSGGALSSTSPRITVNGQPIQLLPTAAGNSSSSSSRRGGLSAREAAAAAPGGGPQQQQQQHANQPYYFLVNKPKGFECSAAPRKEGKGALDLLSPWLRQWERRARQAAKAAAAERGGSSSSSRGGGAANRAQVGGRVCFLCAYEERQTGQPVGLADLLNVGKNEMSPHVDDEPRCCLVGVALCTALCATSPPLAAALVCPNNYIIIFKKKCILMCVDIIAAATACPLVPSLLLGISYWEDVFIMHCNSLLPEQ